MDSEEVKLYRGHVERLSWLLVLLGIMSQLNANYSFPAYNLSFGLWGVFCSISKHGRATLGLIVFLSLASILDIVFCSSNEGHTSGYRFALAMLVLSLFLKMCILYYGSKFFAAIGGQYSLNMDDTTVMEGSGYSSLGTSGTIGGRYYPPSDSSQTSNDLKNSGELTEAMF